MKKNNIILTILLTIIAVLIITVILMRNKEPIKLFDPKPYLENINKAEQQRDSAITELKKLELTLISLDEQKTKVKYKYKTIYVYINNTNDPVILDSIIRANW